MPLSGRRRSVTLTVVALAALFCERAVGTSLHTGQAPPDDAAVRSVAQSFFAAYSTKDLERCLALWSAAAPERAVRQRFLQTQFAGVDRIELQSLTIHRIVVNGDKASLRADVEMRAVDAAGKPAAGFGRMKRALDFVKENGAWSIWQEVNAFDRLANLMLEAGSESERERLLAADDDLLTDDLTRALARRGNRGVFLWEFAQALAGYQLEHAMAVRLGNTLAAAVALNDIGHAHRLLAHYGEAADHFTRSLAMLETLGSRPEMGRALTNLGRLAYDQGNHAAAAGFFDRALTLLQDAGDPLSKALTSDALENIAVVYHAQGSYEIALGYYTRALSIRREIGSKGGEAVTLDRLGSLYGLMGDFDKALEHHRQSLAMSSGAHEGAGLEAGAGALLSVTGDLYALQKKFELAVQYKRKALERYELVSGNAFDHQAVSGTLNELAALELRAGQFADALSHADRSADIARRAGSRAKLWPARDAAGHAHLALGDVTPAQEAFDESIRVIESLRADVAGGEAEQQRFFEDKQSPYHGMVDVLLARDRPAAAIAYAERAKSRVLLDILQSGRVNISSSMTARERDQERRFVDELGSLNGQIVRENFRPVAERTRLADLEAERDQKRREFEAFRSTLYSAHPDLKVHRGEAEPRALDELAALADSDTALLEFVVTDQRTHLFVITRARDAGRSAPVVRAHTVPVPRGEMVALAEGLRASIGRRDLGFRAAAKQLHRLLLAPARDQLRGKTSLVIVPDGPLWALPFQALVSDDDRYVIEDYAVAYAPSLSALHEMTAARQRRAGQGQWRTSLLALGNPVPAAASRGGLRVVYGDTPLGPLPEAEREVSTLQRMYGAAGSKVYVGADAREERFKAESAGARVVHLAAHGVVNTASPMYSHVLLAQPGDSNGEDGLLEAWELMNMDLAAELIVLSACETALGRVGDGEGIIGLTWALFVAGVPTSVVSQWKVDSASTSALMIEFHRRLGAMRTDTRAIRKAEALRRASLTLLRSGESRHPYYWAGFVLVGDGQ